MSYLDRLKGELAEKGPPKELTKPTKGTFVSNVSTPSGHISENHLLIKACDGLDITPEQFDSLLTQEDRNLIIAGKFEDITLRAYAESFAEGIASGRIRLFKGQ